MDCVCVSRKFLTTSFKNILPLFILTCLLKKGGIHHGMFIVLCFICCHVCSVQAKKVLLGCLIFFSFSFKQLFSRTPFSLLGWLYACIAYNFFSQNSVMPLRWLRPHLLFWLDMLSLISKLFTLCKIDQ